MHREAANASHLLPSLGIQVFVPLGTSASRAQREMAELLSQHHLTSACSCITRNTREGTVVQTHLTSEALQAWAPGHDTLGLKQRLSVWQLDPDVGLMREMLVALLASPQGMRFHSVSALVSHMRVRRLIAQAAQKTALAFKTDAAERPYGYWRDGGDEAGFILQPHRCLVDALIAATQPAVTGKLYDFSCYRATEYVILLGIAQELQAHHPELLAQLQQINEAHAIRSAQFHEVYLVEYGSMQTPLPARFYVPGDRLWFRNPDEPSSDVMGYEGSWVIYMGGGLFSNFWQRNRPYTLESKAIEIYHWRDGLFTDAQGQAQMDESVVEQCVAQTQANPEMRAHVLERMLRMRDPKGVYDQGGCLDTTREYPRCVSRDCCELVLPTLAQQRPPPGSSADPIAQGAWRQPVDFTQQLRKRLA
jgi:hypothetical protein